MAMNARARERHREAEKRRREKDPEKYRRYMKEYMRTHHTPIKVEVLSFYGNGKCACVRCGFSDIRALSIDHINNDGGNHRRQLGKAGTSFYKWLKDNNFPDGFQTLCMNCQFIKTQESN